MTTVIVAGALGVIIICGGLFLRRLLGEIAELRRQITWFDRQMRAQRARVTFLRQLITEDEEDQQGDEYEPLAQAAAVNGHTPGILPSPPDGVIPVRRKRHLGLYTYGAAAAAATILRQSATSLTSTAVTAAAGSRASRRSDCPTHATAQPAPAGTQYQPNGQHASISAAART